MNFPKCFRPAGSLCLGLAFFVPPAPTSPAQTASSVPDEPRPVLSTAVGNSSAENPAQSLPRHASPHAASAIEQAPRATRKWAQYMDPGEKIPPLSAGDKIIFSFRRSLVPSALIPEFSSAGFGQLTGGNPKYGVDSGAFGDRLAGDALRQVSFRFLVLGVVPALDHTDPRYLRKASGSRWSRIGWAAERAYVTQRDSGRTGFNNADLFGHLAASFLTMAYYPTPSANGHVVLETFLVSIAGTTGNNEFLEFWPDVVNAWHRHRERVRARRSQTP